MLLSPCLVPWGQENFEFSTHLNWLKSQLKFDKSITKTQTQTTETLYIYSIRKIFHILAIIILILMMTIIGKI